MSKHFIVGLIAVLLGLQLAILVGVRRMDMYNVGYQDGLVAGQADAYYTVCGVTIDKDTPGLEWLTE